VAFWGNLLDQGCQALELAAALNWALCLGVAGGPKSPKILYEQQKLPKEDTQGATKRKSEDLETGTELAF